MYSLNKAGVPILRAINGLADTTQSRLMKVTLEDVAGKLEKGQSFSTCLNAQPRVFSPLFVSIVHVGENTGKLDDAFAQLAFYFERELETRKQIKQAMRYPSFVVAALVIAMFVINIWVIPTFAQLFGRFNVELPWATQVLISTSNFFVNYWPGIIVALSLGFVAIKGYLNTYKGRSQWDWLKLKLPAVGSIIERSTLARFSRSFGMMGKAGVPLTLALNLVAEAGDNVFMGERIKEMRRGIEKGESLLRTSTQSQLFTPLVIQMIAVGEETGRIDELLEEVSDYYEREVDYDLKSLTAKIEPMLIMGVAVMVLILALGIFVPMWDMMSAYQGG